MLRAGDRVLLWAWSWERGRAGSDITAAGWAGALTLCRELSLVDCVVVAPSPIVPPRILVDGSMIEIFDGTATPYTTRAYPTATSRWLLRTERTAAPHAWHLGLS